MATEVKRRCPGGSTLVAWLDCELDPRREAEVSLHVAGCPACRARAQEDRRIESAVRAGADLLGGPRPTLDARRILVRARKAREEEARFLRFLQRISAAAAMVLLASGILISWQAAGGSRAAEARASIRHVAVPPVGLALINEESSIQIVIAR